jgi:hypothetical protein
MAITVQLFYVPQKSLVDFQIHPLESHERILQNIRQRFDVALIEVYTQDAKRQPVNLNLVIEGQILLVTTSPLERPSHMRLSDSSCIVAKRLASSIQVCRESHGTYVKKISKISFLH